MSQTNDPSAEPPQREHSLIDRLRGTGVGTEDPNIVGGAGPTEEAPSQDPPMPPLTEELPPETETPSERMLPSDADIIPVDESEVGWPPAGADRTTDPPTG
ncbi:MAG: hypothetical protein M3083_23885 [Actinomycetota bacterium]|nr:hypothetical protein [Actinomycetota bacterium]